jgi:hypothetical protein
MKITLAHATLVNGEILEAGEHDVDKATKDLLTKSGALEAPGMMLNDGYRRFPVYSPVATVIPSPESITTDNPEFADDGEEGGDGKPDNPAPNGPR